MTFIMVIRPSRPTFPGDATESESAVIGAHFDYIKERHDSGIVQFVGLCEDATFGICVFESDSPEAAQAFVDADPSVAAGLFIPELRPFRTVFA